MQSRIKCHPAAAKNLEHSSSWWLCNKIFNLCYNTIIAKDILNRKSIFSEQKENTQKNTQPATTQQRQWYNPKWFCINTALILSTNLRFRAWIGEWVSPSKLTSRMTLGINNLGESTSTLCKSFFASFQLTSHRWAKIYIQSNAVKRKLRSKAAMNCWFPHTAKYRELVILIKKDDIIQGTSNLRFPRCGMETVCRGRKIQI